MSNSSKDQPSDKGEQAAQIGSTPIYKTSSTVSYTAGLAIDADGSPNAYGPPEAPGLDYLGNAGQPGKWWGVAVGEDGQPVIQGPSDPSPGKYVSSTALTNPGPWLKGDPRRYIDSEAVPFIAIPPELRDLGVSLGDLALVTYGGASSWAVVADIGPKGKIGEGSIALASSLGIASDPKRGGVSSGVSVTIYTGQRPTAYTAADIHAAGERLA